MFRIFFTAMAITMLLGAPAMSQVSQKQQQAIEKRESSGESNSQKQLGGLKRDRQISRGILGNAYNRMRTHHYRSERYGR